jgi:hypothetical protein
MLLQPLLTVLFHRERKRERPNLLFQLLHLLLCHTQHTPASWLMQIPLILPALSTQLLLHCCQLLSQLLHFHC